MSLVWKLQKSRPREGREAEFAALEERWSKLPVGHPDRDVLAFRLADLGVTVWEVMGCPRVGHDVEADDWIEWHMIDGHPRPLHGDPKERAKLRQGHVDEHRGHYVFQLAMDDRGVPPSELRHAVLDFQGWVVGQCDALSDAVRREAFEDHTAWQAAAFAATILQSVEEPADLPEPVDLAVAWLRYWGSRGFGFKVWW